MELQAGLSSPAAVKIGTKSTSTSADAVTAKRPAGDTAVDVSAQPDQHVSNECGVDRQ